MTGQWLVGKPMATGAKLLPTLVCLPPAGTGGRQFLAWQPTLGHRFQVYGVQLPGRENRWREPMPTTVSDAVGHIGAELCERVPPDTPTVLFGHSFGGLLGYELCRLLADVGRPPAALVVSACRPPSQWSGLGQGIVDGDRALADLFDAGDVLGGVLDEDSRQLLLTVLRADARLSLSYAPATLQPLNVPLQAWGADADTTVTPDDVGGWRSFTVGGFAQRQVRGGHHELLRRPELVLPELAMLLDPASRAE